MTSTTLIDIEDVSIQYQNHLAVDQVSFEINDGDFLVIAGENGSGKSTLMKAILGLLPLKSGHIHYSSGIQNQIGYLPQVTQIQKDFPASVFEVVQSGHINQLQKGRFYTKQMKETTLKNLRLLEIDHLKDVSFKDLSGGQRQRVLLARALCATTSILFLDEPVASLDVNITQSLFELLKQLNQQHGLTIVMITHDVADIIPYASKVLRMNTHLSFYGETQDYLQAMGVRD